MNLVTNTINWATIPRDGTYIVFIDEQNQTKIARWSDTSHHGDMIPTVEGGYITGGCWVKGSGLLEERVFVNGVKWRFATQDEIIEVEFR